MLMRFDVRLEAAKRFAKGKAKARYEYVTFNGTKGAAVALQRSERTAPNGRMRMQGESS